MWKRKESTSRFRITPDSFHLHDYSSTDRFKKWVDFRIGKKKSFLNFLGKKCTPLFLVYGSDNKFLLFESEADYGVKDSLFNYDMSSASLEQVNHSKNMIVIKTVETKDKIAVIKCLNNLDLDELVAYMDESRVKRSQKAKALKRSCSSGFDLGGEEEEEEGEEEEERRNESLEAERNVTMLEDWTCSHLLDWCRDVIVGKKFDQTFYDLTKDYIRKNELSGKDLLDFSHSQVDSFVRMFKMTSTEKRRIAKELKRIIKKKQYDRRANVVTKKVVQMLQYKGSPFSYLDIVNLRRCFRNEREVEKQIINIICGSPNPSKEQLTRKRFYIKVNIVENLQEERQKRFRRALGILVGINDMVNSVVSTSNNHQTTNKKKNKNHQRKKSVGTGEKTAEFGLFHISLSIGPLQLEYVDTGLVILRPVCSERVIMCCDVGSILIPDVTLFAKQLTSIVIHWNENYHYQSLITCMTNKYYKNCQNFVTKLLDDLNVEWKLQGRVKKFTNSMKKYGVCEKIFKFDKKFSDTFFPRNQLFYPHGHEISIACQQKKEFRPKTHGELDKFVQHLFRVCPTFERDYNEEYLLLKGFDRAYWMGYMGIQEDPLSDPQASFTFSPDIRKEKKLMTWKWLNGDHEESEEEDENEWRYSGCPFTKPQEKS